MAGGRPGTGSGAPHDGSGALDTHGRLANGGPAWPEAQSGSSSGFCSKPFHGARFAHEAGTSIHGATLAGHEMQAQRHGELSSKKRYGRIRAWNFRRR
ncbi:hypothetical protein MTBSS4_500003 [Magnetospirillum sp. SS-4]|nr:hypothetical protein MTBSS4_500003 [Magnetospirillum sp. SS-4]